MKTAIAKVKSALAVKDLASHLSHYLVKDKMIMASDNRILAAAPFPFFDGEFLVPGPEFEALVDRLEGNIEITLGEHDVTFRSGRLKGTLQTLPTDTVNYQHTNGDWQELPRNFLEALRTVRPFVSDNAVHYWALSICLSDSMVYATNNVVVAGASCPGLKGEGRLLPSWAADYILSRQEGLETLITDQGSMTFLWSDGSWMKTQLVDSKFPEAAENLISEITTIPNFTLDEDWKKAYETISSLSDSIIELLPDKMVARSAHGVTEFACPSPGSSKWSKKYLDEVVKVADYFEPDRWPKPCPFVGSHIKGLIVGRQ